MFLKMVGNIVRKQGPGENYHHHRATEHKCYKLLNKLKKQRKKKVDPKSNKQTNETVTLVSPRKEI